MYVIHVSRIINAIYYDIIYLYISIYIYIYALCNISSPVFVKLRLSQILRLEDAICRCQGLWMHEVGCMFSTQRNPWQKRTQGFAAHFAQKPNTSNDCLDCRMTVLSVLRITQSVKNSQKEGNILKCSSDEADVWH